MLEDNLQLVDETPVPKSFGTKKWIDFARELGDEFEVYRDARKVLTEEIWPACDRAFHCIRDDISGAIPTMKFIDNGQLGEASVRVAVKSIRNQILTGLLPTDEAWCKPASLNEDDTEDDLNTIQDYLLYLSDRAKMRGACEISLDQLLVRGTTAQTVRWDRVQAVRRMLAPVKETLTEVAAAMDDPEKQQSLIQEVEPAISTAKYWVEKYSGPLVEPIDMHRLWLDPKSELQVDADVPMIRVVFKTMSDLKRAKDDDDNYLYSHSDLKQIQEWTYQDYYRENPQACESTKIMGVDPSLKNEEKFVPVYIFHRLIRENRDGDIRLVDKFIYVARSSMGANWRIIRIHDNPSDNGDKPWLVAACDRWMNTPYGTGLVEKSLSAWKAQNIISALGLNAKVLHVFPPMWYVGGVLKDDKKPKIMPAGWQEIVNRPGVGKDWCGPMPINPNNVLLAMQEERQYTEKIDSQVGVTNAGLMADPARSMTKGRTATEVRQAATEGTLAQQVFVDRLGGDFIQPSAQMIYNLARQHAKDEAQFVKRTQSGEVTTLRVPKQLLDRDREVHIVGKRALMNKANILDSLVKALEILSRPDAVSVIPNLPLMLQDIIFKLLGQLGVPMKPEYKTPPEMLAAQSPQAQMAALEGAMQNPELRQMLAEELLNSPEGREIALQLLQAGSEIGAASGGEQQIPQKQPRSKTA